MTDLDAIRRLREALDAGGGDPREVVHGILWDGIPALVRSYDARTAALRIARGCLLAIQGWDCLNPPQAELLADLPWLKTIVDDALERTALSDDKP